MTTELSFIETSISGVTLIETSRFEDYRGTYQELYDDKKYVPATSGLNFVQDDISISRRGVLRGIHGDPDTCKLITILNGSVYLVVVDNRPGSMTHHKWEAFTLSRANMKQLLIPAGVGNAMLALDDDIMFHYKQTSHYGSPTQFTLRWNDPALGIWWPISDPILSVRDATCPLIGGV